MGKDLLDLLDLEIGDEQVMISCLKIAVCGQEDYSLECRCNNMLMIPD